MNAVTFPELELLKSRFDHDSFRPHQLEAIRALKKGKNLFLRKPTGGGKSLIYQFLAFEGPVLVLSPLVALMDDQTKQARKAGLKAFCIHSQQSSQEREKSLKAWTGNEPAQILFVTPERFSKISFRKALSERPPQYFVVDEAHCASMWGHDFRPDYSKIAEIKSFLKDPVTLACTATATLETEKDIIKQTGIEGCEILRDPILRENLTHEVNEAFDYEEKLELLLEKVSSFTGPALIYFTLIKNLENVARVLEKKGVLHTKYHSKLNSKYRRDQQTLFMSGESDLMLATPAFGLGVDKPDIRHLIHFELPGSVEAYAQEFGRAGRDGEPSKCDLFYSQEDLQVQMDFIKWSHPEPDTIRWIYRQICNTKDVGYPENTLDELKKKMNFYNSYDFRLESAVNILKRWECLRSEKGVLFKGPEDLENVPDVVGDWHSELKKHQQMKLYDVLKMIKLPVEEQKDFLEDYFG